MRLDHCRELKHRLLEGIPDMGGRENWVALGIRRTAPDSYELAVRVADRATSDDRLRRIAEAAGDELEVRAVGRIQPLTAPSPDKLQQRHRPLVPGCSLAQVDVATGTLGGFVTVGGALHALSTSHVLGNSGLAELGDRVLQPSPADGGRDPDDRVANLTTMVPLRSSGANMVDAAVAEIDDDIDVDVTAYPAGAINRTTDDPPADNLVDALGRSCGHVRGAVTAFEMDGLRVSFPDGVLRFDDQIEITGHEGGFGLSGDSGAVVWTRTERAAFGLLFAGSEIGGTGGAGLNYANPLRAVLAELDVTWATELP